MQRRSRWRSTRATRSRGSISPICHRGRGIRRVAPSRLMWTPRGATPTRSVRGSPSSLGGARWRRSPSADSPLSPLVRSACMALPTASGSRRWGAAEPAWPAWPARRAHRACRARRALRISARLARARTSCATRVYSATRSTRVTTCPPPPTWWQSPAAFGICSAHRGVCSRPPRPSRVSQSTTAAPSTRGSKGGLRPTRWTRPHRPRSISSRRSCGCTRGSAPP